MPQPLQLLHTRSPWSIFPIHYIQASVSTPFLAIHNEDKLPKFPALEMSEFVNRRALKNLKIK